ncbi:MAG: hypothetical protein ACRYF3_17245, partial [Janthinobacterium lividum]
MTPTGSSGGRLGESVFVVDPADPRPSGARPASPRPSSGQPSSPRPARPRSARRATPGQWVAATRPRTLPASLAPVIVGTGAAATLGGAAWLPAILAGVVA